MKVRFLDTRGARSAMHGLSLVALLAAACHASPPQPASVAARVAVHDAQRSELAAQLITPDYLRQQVARISADETEGRAPGTVGDQRARTYLVEQLAALGLEPGRGSEGWEQAVALRSISTALPDVWSFAHGSQRLSLRKDEDFVAGSGVQSASGTISATDVVFVGYGIEAPEYGWDDFKGRDVRGKILLMLNSDPDWDPALFGGSTRLYYGRWTYKFESAARHGAAGALIVHTTPSAGYPFQVVRTSWGGPQFALPSTDSRGLVVKGWLSEDAARKLVQLSGKDLEQLTQAARSKEFAPIPLELTSALHFETALSDTSSANVYGIIRGSDPKLADQYVVISAHHDHLGVGKPDARGDTIYNGALDNGAGLAQVLAIARALKALPTAPRRSVIILFPAAEEQGLLGSLYFAQHPPVPPAKIAANINFDGGNIWGKTRDITQVGHGKSSLDQVAEQIARQQGRVVKPDQFPDRGSFYRSDQFSFAQIGVPALYMKTGLDVVGRAEGWGREQVLAFEAHSYHQPSDQLGPEWNFDGMVEDARFAFLAALQIADADQAPTWNAGDEFEAARRAALEREAR